MIGRNKIRAVQEAVTLQYANGKSLGRRGSGGRFAPLVGFHIEVGRDGHVDSILSDLRIEQVEIKHQRPGGAEVIRHWFLGEEVRLFVVTSGPVAPTVASSVRGPNAKATAEAGIGLRWGSSERSKLAIRGYLTQLAQAQCFRLVQFSVRSRMTDELLTALLDHGRVCELADSMVDRAKHPEVVSFHEIALPLGAGEEVDWGKGESTTVVPCVSRHPKQLEADYLRAMWRPEGVQAAALRDWESIQTWANEYAAQGEEPLSRATNEDPASYAEEVL